ncbi:glycosyltransferase family 2 protein [Aestuariivirga litoralis]|nr:glycosyltransferase family 2 protein [Aestuariivirga litoralis]
MPCLNEAETIGICIEKAMASLAKNKWSGEVVIADNGSTDGSIEIALRLGARVVHVPLKGYGAALGQGIAAARGRWVIMGDSDDSYDFGALEPFVESLRAGADLVLGNRFKGGIKPGAMPFLHRYLGNPVLSFIGRLFFSIKAGDFHCGLRGVNRARMLELKLQSTGMEFASEMVVRVALAGLTIAEVPTTLAPDGRSRPPHLRTWRDGWRHLKFLLMYSPRWLYVIPGIALLSLGFVIAALLFGMQVRIGSIALDLNSFMVACFLCVVGVQFLATGAVARQFATQAGYLPVTGNLIRLNRILTTERLSLISLVVILCGLGVFSYAMWLWARVDFSALTNPFAPRSVMAGLTLVVIGLQLFSLAFLSGILQVPHQQAATAVPHDDTD